ncbi:MAG: 4Fe-4S dicluster domain-containing protein [Candidatus Thorarchaeota archaeon]|jgi:NAD-dependent dihydropyrimidine dehydrogenase PreA subunit
MIIYDYDACTGCEDCLKVCPRGVWAIETDVKKAMLVNPSKCLDCTACELQCPVRAIRIEKDLIPKPALVIRSADGHVL